MSRIIVVKRLGIDTCRTWLDTSFVAAFCSATAWGIPGWPNSNLLMNKVKRIEIVNDLNLNRRIWKKQKL